MTQTHNASERYQRPFIITVPCGLRSLVCTSADGSFPDWIDDGELDDIGSGSHTL